MTDTQKYIRADILNTQVDKDLVLLDEKSGTYYATSDVGATIWALLAEPRTVADLCAELTKTYDVDPAECEADTRGFVNEMIAASLVVPA